MSSRALRKLQREAEETRQLEVEDEKQDAESSEVEEELQSKPFNAFDMLNIEEEDMNDALDTAEDAISNLDRSAVDVGEAEQTQSQVTKSNKAKKRKKGKRKRLGVNPGGSQMKGDIVTSETSGMDEIDLALKSLSMQTPQTNQAVGVTIDEANEQLHRLLAVEAKHLNALNEMKRLFGNVVMENDDEDEAGPRQRGRGPHNIGLGAALSARHSPVSKGQGLKGLALKRNTFIMGKEDWPQVTSGGLGMELVEKMEDGTVEYRFVHNTIYQDVQRQFESCVASLDPQRMITLLQYNPYHVSTLLQVSEIAKQQGDHSVSGDLLERALFTFGRSVHSSFTNALSQGKARLDFRRPENREFWLAAWRFTKDLGQRGTWRTAYEWAKLVLSLDPEGDPFCIAKWLDQLALRGGQSEHYLRLSQQSLFSEDVWKHMPNVLISRSLAQSRLKQQQECRSTLTKAVADYPYIFTRLFQELNLPHTPKSIWGQLPRTHREKLDTETYVLGAKELWSTPEAISLLDEVVESAPASNPPPPNETPITLDEARYTILSGNPALINLIPREFTTLPNTSSDPLPPTDNASSYDSSLPQSTSHRDPELEAAYADVSDTEDVDHAQPTEVPGLTGFFSRLMGRFVRADVDSPSDPRAYSIMQAALAETDARGGIDSMTDGDRQLINSLYTANLDDPEDNGTQNSISLLQHLVGAGRDPDSVEPDSDDSVSEHGSDSLPEVDEGAISQTPPPQPEANQAGVLPDDDILKRYLAGSGLMGLRSHAEKYPGRSTAEVWEDNPEGRRLLHEYAGKLRQLRNARTREFVLKYALPQGVGAEVKVLVEGRL